MKAAHDPTLASLAAAIPTSGSDPGRALAPVRNLARSLWNEASIAINLHADAFRIDPKAYLQALAWRFRGLRVRSRSRILTLTARSPHAYDLWIARNESRLMRSAVADCRSVDGGETVILVIDCRAHCEGLDETLASLDLAGLKVKPVLLGGPSLRNTVRIQNVEDLTGFPGTDEAWFCIIQPGDRLAAGALAIYANHAAQAGEARVIYADDDLIYSCGKRRVPHFKPEWNPDLFLHHDFISGSAIVRASRDDLLGAPAAAWPKSMIDIAIRHSPPLHLPFVLHHRRSRSSPTIPEKPKIAVDTIMSVTAIVPSRNQVGLLRKCVEGLRRTAYPALDIIVVDNGSDDVETLAYLRSLEAEGATILREPGPFNFSALNNKAVASAKGELLCFLNNDIEMLDSDWLAMMVLQAMRPEIGAVGARLLYPDGTIQHAGVFVGIGGAAGHAHRFQSADDTGYFERARLPQRVSAVTAACLVVKRQKFLAVGGFDEVDFPVAFNDVDLCLKLNDRGWASFYEPRATLIHHESKSRGNDYDKSNRVRFAGELGALKRKWRTEAARDPYHHPHLSRISERFLIAI